MSLVAPPYTMNMRRPIPAFNMAGIKTAKFPPPLSPFQTLPYDIIDQIIQYALCGVNPARYKVWRKAYPFMQCCKNWRTAFFQREFSEMTVKLKRTLPLGLSFSKRAYPANPRLYPIEQCVRHLVLVVTSWKSLSTGESLSWIQESVVMGRINKAAVSSLKIEGFSGDEWVAYFRKDADAAATRLVELLTYLHETFPNLQRISLNILKWEFLRYVDRNDHRVEKALAALFHGRDVEMFAKFVKDSFKTMNPRYFTGISSLRIESANGYNYNKYSEDWILKVVRLNAPTLRRLHLCVIHDELLEGITISKAGNRMTYPKLKSLTTRVNCFKKKEQIERTQAFARGELEGHSFRHFPALEHINLFGRKYIPRWVAPDGDAAK